MAGYSMKSSGVVVVVVDERHGAVPNHLFIIVAQKIDGAGN